MWCSLIRPRQPFFFLSFSSILSFSRLHFVVLVSVLSLSSVCPFCHFLNRSLYFILFHRSGILFFVVSSFAFVVFLLNLIRERRGALIFALNEESATKVIAADSSLLTIFFHSNTNLISYLPA